MFLPKRLKRPVLHLPRKHNVLYNVTNNCYLFCLLSHFKRSILRPYLMNHDCYKRQLHRETCNLKLDLLTLSCNIWQLRWIITVCYLIVCFNIDLLFIYIIYIFVHCCNCIFNFHELPTLRCVRLRHHNSDLFYQ
jgi:hypothetical protein